MYYQFVQSLRSPHPSEPAVQHCAQCLIAASQSILLQAFQSIATEGQELSVHTNCTRSGAALATLCSKRTNRLITPASKTQLPFFFISASTEYFPAPNVCSKSKPPATPTLVKKCERTCSWNCLHEKGAL